MRAADEARRRVLAQIDIPVINKTLPPGAALSTSRQANRLTRTA